jgi:hypothetical protein
MGRALLVWPFLAFALSLSALISAPAIADDTFVSVPGHEPVWAVSAYGGYYDATGVIQGTVAQADLHRYGGRFVDGRPVSGAPKRRDADGALLSETEYWSYRQSLTERLNDRIDTLQNMQTQGYDASDIHARNLQSEIKQLKVQVSDLDRKYPRFASSNLGMTPGLPGARDENPDLPGLNQNQFGQSPAYSSPLSNQGSNGFPQMGQPKLSFKQHLINQGLKMVLGKMGF